MNINVVNARINCNSNQSNSKISNQQSEEFNDIFSSVLNQKSMSSQDEEMTDTNNPEEMMDEIATLMVPMSLVNSMISIQCQEREEIIFLQKMPSELSQDIEFVNGLNLFRSVNLDIDSSSASQVSQMTTIESKNQFSIENELNQKQMMQEQLSNSSFISDIDEKLIGINQQNVNSLFLEMNTQNQTVNKGMNLAIGDHLTQDKVLHTFDDKLVNTIKQKDDLQSNILNFRDGVESDLLNKEITNNHESLVVSDEMLPLKSEQMVQGDIVKQISDPNSLQWDNRSEIMANLRYQMNILKENDFTTLQLKLYPQHLGSISVELKMKDGILNANVLVEHAELKTILEQEIHQINLDGTTIEQLNVEVNAHNQQQSKYPQTSINKESNKLIVDEELIEEIIEKQTEIQQIGYLNVIV